MKQTTGLKDKDYDSILTQNDKIEGLLPGPLNGNTSNDFSDNYSLSNESDDSDKD